jgi:hypothetical protein
LSGAEENLLMCFGNDIQCKPKECSTVLKDGLPSNFGVEVSDSSSWINENVQGRGGQVGHSGPQVGSRRPLVHSPNETVT